MGTYSSQRIRAATESVLTRAPVARRDAAGEPATAGNFYRLREEACLLFLLRPQALYHLAYKANYGARAHLDATVTEVEDTALALLDALDPSVDIGGTDELDQAVAAIQKVENVMLLGSEVGNADTAIRQYEEGLDAFLAGGIRSNVLLRVGDRSQLETSRVGREALTDAVTHLTAMRTLHLQLFRRIYLLRRTIKTADARLFRRAVSPGLVERVRAGVAGASAYYAATDAGEAQETVSSVLANLLAGKASLSAVRSARSVWAPKLQSPDPDLESPRSVPEGSDYVLRPLEPVVPPSIAGTAALADPLPIGAALTYAASGSADRVVTLPWAGLYTIMGTLSVTGVTIPAGSFLFIEYGGVTYPVVLTAGVASITQVIADVNGAGLAVSAAELGATGRLVLYSAAVFTLVSSYAGIQSASVTSDVISTFVLNTESLVATVSDSTGVNSQVFSGIAAPAVNAAGLALLLQAAGFGSTFFTVAAVGNTVVLTTVEQGEGVSISIDVLQSSIISTGLMGWAQPTSLGVSIGTNTAQALLGLGADEAVLGGRSPELVVAINSVESGGLAQASLDDSGNLVLTSLDTTVASSLEVKSMSGLSMPLGLVRGTLQHGEVFGRSATEAADAVAPLARFGVVVGDGIRVLGPNRQYSGTVTAVGDTQVMMTSDIPANAGNILVSIMDASTDSYRDMLDGIRRSLALIGSSRLASRVAIDAFYRRVVMLSGRPELDRGHAKQLIAVVLEVLSLLTDTPPQAAALDERLGVLDLTRPTAAVTLQGALELYTIGADDETVEAVESMLSAFEERGYDRATKLLIQGDISGFLELTPNTASVSGNLEAAMRVAAKSTVPRRTEAQVVQQVPAVSAPIASPSSTRAEK